MWEAQVSSLAPPNKEESVFTNAKVILVAWNTLMQKKKITQSPFARAKQTVLKLCSVFPSNCSQV